ncbi:MAG: hypothetical protein R3Y36_06725 [Spirochaetales bacterium]
MILLPYLRATLTSVLSSSGFSVILMPLININKVAKELNVEIEDLDITQK